jgi:hypothetical protein
MKQLTQYKTALDRIQPGYFADQIPESQDRWLQQRRVCLERYSEMVVQDAMEKQMHAEADRLVERARETGDTDVLHKMHMAKANTLRAQAQISRERKKQAEMELTAWLERMNLWPL